MKKETAPIILVIIALACTSNTYSDDTVVFKNGDVLTGQILKETDENVYFRSSAFGAVSLRNEDIAEVRFQTEPHGQIATEPETGKNPGTLETPQNPDNLVGPPPAPQPKAKPAPKSKWSGQTGLSIAMRESVKYDSTGSINGTDNIETYQFYGDMAWKSDQDKLRWNWTYRYSRDEYETQDDFFNLTQQYTHDFSKDYYATSKTMYQHDYRRRVDREYLQTAEMGVKWINLPDLEMATSAGGGYHKFYLINGSSIQSKEEISVFFDQSLKWKIISSLTLLQKYTHLGDLSNYHSVFTTGLENKLIHDIFLRMEYRLDRDTGIASKNGGYYDKALLTSLLFKF